MPSDQRRYLRYDFIYSVEYVLNPKTTEEIFTGVITDISNSGLGLYTTTLLSEGQEIEIKSILPIYSQTAVVRWIKDFDETSFKVGLEFKK